MHTPFIENRGTSTILAGKTLANNKKNTVRGFTLDKTDLAHSPQAYAYQEGNGHLLSVAATGKGKGRNQIIPALLSYEGSCIVIDPKGEATSTTARFREKYGKVIYLDFCKLVKQHPDTFNPLDAFRYIKGNSVQKALRLTELLLAGYSGFEKDPFWDHWANKVISGLIHFILNDPSAEEKTLYRLRKLLTDDDVIYKFAVILDTQKKWMTESAELEYAYYELAQLLQLPEKETRPSVIATTQQHIKLLGDPDVIEATRKTTFDIEAFIRGEPMTIYIIIPPAYLRTHGQLLRIWVGTLLELVTERQVLPDIPTLFMIDEVAQLGRMDAFLTATTLLRGYGVRVWSFWQDLSQLKRLYAQEWETIINNADAFFTFGVTTPMMAKALAEVIDLPYQEILRLPKEQLIMALPGGEIQYLEKVDYLTDKLFKGKYTPNPMFARPEIETQAKSLVKLINASTQTIA